MHADHVTGSGLLKKYCSVKSVVSEASKGMADIKIKDGTLFCFYLSCLAFFLNKLRLLSFLIIGDVIRFGSEVLNCLSTPGHTNGCFSFVNHRAKLVFTGDALMIRTCGRTDFQQGKHKLFQVRSLMW